MATILERNKNIKPKTKTREEYAEDALYREVWEEVNNDKTIAFLKKYYRQMIAVALGLLVVVTGVQLGIRGYRARQMMVAGMYENAVATMDVNALTNLSHNSSGAMSDLALFQSYMMDKDISKLESLASDGSTRDLRDLAKMHLATINGDKMDADEFAKYLGSMDTKSSPFYYSSRLLVAQKYLSAGNRDKANVILDELISDAECPATISANAQMLK